MLSKALSQLYLSDILMQHKSIDEEELKCWLLEILSVLKHCLCKDFIFRVFTFQTGQIH